MDQFAYPARFTPDEGGTCMIRFRDLPEAITSGRDMADAIEQAAIIPIATPGHEQCGDFNNVVALLSTGIQVHQLLQHSMGRILLGFEVRKRDVSNILRRVHVLQVFEHFGVGGLS